MTRPTALVAATMFALLGGTTAAADSPRSVIEALAEMSARSSEAPRALGEPGGNLVVNPVTPCRLFDTRQASPRGGALLAQQSRGFFAFGQDFSATQGGAEGDCGIGDDLEVEAVVVNLTLVEPLAAGFATAWATGEDLPLAATLSYATGQTVSNEVIVPINADPGEEDFQVYSFRQAHAVADVVGFLSRPEAAALDCVLGPAEVFELPPSTLEVFFAPDCPSGYSPVSALCENASGTLMASGVIAGNGALCGFGNPTASEITAIGAAHCCRIPGR